MPRKKRVNLKRELISDVKYGDKNITQLINKVMWAGKKGISEGIVYGAFEIIKEKKGDNPVELYRKALENIKPVMEVRSRRVGGANYQVPTEVRPGRRNSLALRWLIDSARSRGEKTMGQKLAGEIMDALDNKGAAMKKKEETHKMAEANKAFAHYKW